MDKNDNKRHEYFPFMGDRILRNRYPALYIYQVDYYDNEFVVETEYFFSEKVLSRRNIEYVSEVFLDECHIGADITDVKISVCTDCPHVDYIWAAFD